ncbi:SLIT and NTRK-like protein 2 [Chiloscyllium punctatum]|uniref:LRRCT domain-containing protein n=1 Tax=Chiloscyllium punctatum TaxID=137246 RepID=A0A401S729_CHIPU|nr:hypothetical protein [Chiloscyllium punctatum]
MLSRVVVLSALACCCLCPRGAAESRRRELCRSRCVCEERDSVLNVNCEARGFTRVSGLQPPQHRLYQLFLNGNSLTKLPANCFTNFSQAVTLHLGSNGLQEIRNGAFQGLTLLKSLHLDNNRLEVLREDTFLGLVSLEYLQADYNYISSIEPGAFNRMHKLKILILNDNLLPNLPGNIFRFVLLTHLDLRGNRLRKLPFSGVLEHIGGIAEIQLEENPWNCSCELLPLKSWLDSSSLQGGELACESPFRLHGRLLAQLSRQDICPRRAHSGGGGDSGLRIQRPPPRAQPQPLATAAQPGSRTGRTPAGGKGKPAATPAPDPRQMRGSQSRLAGQPDCPGLCWCNVQNSDSALHVHCHERRIGNLSELQPRPSSPRKLYLTGNLLHIVQVHDLEEYGSLELLHLGSNRISVIQEGAFRNLSNLRRLYLNGNHIERLSPALFVGLHRLQHLYLESNVIKEILQYTFHSLARLSLLHLNNNLLRSLPANVFVGTNLSRLNLRNNHFSQLPVRGLLDQLPATVHLDLRENPWHCGCPIVALKSWMERAGSGVRTSELSCESPAKYAGRALRTLRAEEICSEHSDLSATALTRSPGKPKLLDGELGTASPEAAQASAVPLSVLILGLLVVFILSVCFGAGLFVFVLKRRKTAQSGHGGANHSPDLNSYQLQYPSYGGEGTDKAETHVYNYISHPLGQMCKNPIYVQREGEQVAYYRDLEGKKPPSAAPAYSISTVELLEHRPPPATPSELLYQNLAERPKALPGAHYSFCTLPKRPFGPAQDSRHKEQDRLNKTVLYGTPRKQLREASRGDSLCLRGKLQAEPDYLEMLERQTAISQL